MSYFKAGVRIGLIISGALSTVILFESVSSVLIKRLDRYLDEKLCCEDNDICEEQPDTSDDLK